MKGQKRGTCKTCKGAIHFYPVLHEAEPIVIGEKVLGEWAHIDPADWVDNPHAVDPEESVA